MFDLGITDHLEGPRDQPSREVYDEVAEVVRHADEQGVRYAWFAEHHAHAHFGHCPTPLLFALHLAAQTKQIRLGTAILCLNLHPPLAVAEQVAVADVLTGGRLAPGFGSGSTPEEFALFNQPETAEEERHARFEESLQVILAEWSPPTPHPTPGPELQATTRISGSSAPRRFFNVPPHASLPIPAADLPSRCWLAVNSAGSAAIAGRLNFNMLFSHLRTPAQYRDYTAAYRAAGGAGKIAANRPVFVGPDDRAAFATAEPALRTLWRRFRQEGKIPVDTPEPAAVEALCAHPINFIVGGPATVARQLRDLHAEAPFDVANVELRWAGLSHSQVLDSLQRLTRDVLPSAGHR